MNTQVEGFTMDTMASMTAESALLGGLLLSNSIWDNIANIVTVDDFFSCDHRLIFAAIDALISGNKAADVVTVNDRLGDSIGLQRLNEMAQFVPSPTNVKGYAEIIRAHSLSRKMFVAGSSISEIAADHGRSIDERFEDASSQFYKLLEGGPKRDDWQESRAGMVVFIDEIQRRADGEVNFLPTGISALDEKLDGGMREGEVIVLAARPSMGKTALGVTIGENVAQAGHAVGILSMEMPKAQVHTRRVSMHSRIPLHKLKRPERLSDSDWSAMTESVECIGKYPVFVSDQTGLTINHVRTKSRALKRRHGLRVLIIDYIGLMEGTDRKANRTIQLAEVSRGLKSLAKELGITILLLAQLNREVEKRPNMRPILSDLRECGDIEQDADIVVFIHRPFHVKPELGPEWKHYAELIVAKNRDGQVGLIDAQYIGETVCFSDWQGNRPTSKMRANNYEL